MVAAAVILNRDKDYPELNDSKQLTEKKRMLLRDLVMQEALSYGVGVVSPQEIDKINILNASFLAMHRALDQLKLQPELLLIDGNRFNPYKKIKHVCIVGGDAKYQSIAAASILAKTTRDMMMGLVDFAYAHGDLELRLFHATLATTPENIAAVMEELDF